MSRGPQRRIRVKVKRLPHADGLPLPAYQSIEAAGIDLIAAVPQGKPLKLKPRARLLVPTGLMVELPPGSEAQVRPRSGLAYKHGVTVLNAPGTIDSDFRGELQVLLINLGTETFTIARGERIAQLVVQLVARATLIEVEDIAATRRGAGGFGSTGVAAQLPAGRRPLTQKKSKRISATRRGGNAHSNRTR